MGFKLKEGRWKLDTRKKFFTGVVLLQAAQKSCGCLDALSLEVLQARLDRAPGNLI